MPVFTRGWLRVMPETPPEHLCYSPVTKPAPPPPTSRKAYAAWQARRLVTKFIPSFPRIQPRSCPKPPRILVEWTFPVDCPCCSHTGTLSVSFPLRGTNPLSLPRAWPTTQPGNSGGSTSGSNSETSSFS